MEVMEGLDQVFLFDDGGMRDGLEELSMAEQPRRQKAAFPEGTNALCIHGKAVIRSLFVHPRTRFENAISWKMNPLLVNTRWFAIGSGPCHQGIRISYEPYNSNGRFCQQEYAVATYRENIGFSFTDE